MYEALFHMYKNVKMKKNSHFTEFLKTQAEAKKNQKFVTLRPLVTQPRLSRTVYSLRYFQLDCGGTICDQNQGQEGR